MSVEQQEQTAAEWLAREDRGLTAQEHAAMQAWLDESSLNRVAYLRLKGAWIRADRLAALRAPRRAALARGGVGLPHWGLLAAAALLLALVAGGAFHFLNWHFLNWDFLNRPQPSAQTYVTPVGANQQVRLADGSRMELNTDTRVHAEVTSTSRTVTLDSGEAYFDVVHDAARPFMVYAGNRRITDLGTRFSVYRKGEDVRVTVQEGRVRVDLLDSPTPTAPVVAEAGHAVIARGAETLLISKSPHDIANELSWRSGMLVFNQQTLAEAAEQFNRYNRQRIVVEGSARKIRIGGSFKEDNVAGFAALLHQGFGLTVSRRGDDIIVSR
jgi:transmembrane sensor